MSEELQQKGYLNKNGEAKGDTVGLYESFNIGATTLDQLRRAGIIPDRDYGRFKKNKPDGIVVDRRGPSPEVKFLVEYKKSGKLDSEQRTNEFIEKVADEYCRPLDCFFAGVSDARRGFLSKTATGSLFVERMTIRSTLRLILQLRRGVTLSRRRLRAHILKTCNLEAIISLPKNTFYSTPKKTYILVLRKKQSEEDRQMDPVFTYLVR